METKGARRMVITFEDVVVISILLYAFYHFIKLIVFMVKISKVIKKLNNPWWKLKEYGGWI